ncbi:alanine:cation symporter family protein [Vibrio metschnikovii]
MWLAALFGMATKYAECLLAVKYRKVDDKGQMVGGPMYYLRDGVGSNTLAILFAVFVPRRCLFWYRYFPYKLMPF